MDLTNRPRLQSSTTLLIPPPPQRSLFTTSISNSLSHHALWPFPAPALYVRTDHPASQMPLVQLTPIALPDQRTPPTIMPRQSMPTGTRLSRPSLYPDRPS
jgi:hypothetical protein